MWHPKGSRTASACLLLIVAFTQASCGGGKGTTAIVAPTLASIALAPLTVSLAPGGTQQLTVTGTLTDGTTHPLAASAETFASSDTAHMEEHATKIMGLGGDGILKLQNDIQAMLDTDLNFVYTDAIPASGVYTSASDYALFLRRILTGHYQMSATLSADAVCTNSTVAGCIAVAGQSPVATASGNAEAWHYGLAIGLKTTRWSVTARSAAPERWGFIPGSTRPRLTTGSLRARFSMPGPMASTKAITLRSAVV